MPSVDHDGVERTSGERDGEYFFRFNSSWCLRNSHVKEEGMGSKQTQRKSKRVKIGTQASVNR